LELVGRMHTEIFAGVEPNATDRVDPIAIDKQHKWDIKFIQRFMIVFGLVSSVFDYLTFVVLLYLLSANEKFFKQGGLRSLSFLQH